MVLEVSDNGRGVPPEKLAGLTRRFERGVEIGHGAGLGLSIVEEIASLFGGTLGITSTDGRGFSAVVTLKAKGDSETATAPQANAASGTDQKARA